jgi:hypothetical protein
MKQSRTSGSSGTRIENKNMDDRMKYWKQMKSHTRVTSFCSSKTVIVKHTNAEFVMTHATAIMVKIVCQVPMSCAKYVISPVHLFKSQAHHGHDGMHLYSRWNWTLVDAEKLMSISAYLNIVREKC